MYLGSDFQSFSKNTFEMEKQHRNSLKVESVDEI